VKVKQYVRLGIWFFLEAEKEKEKQKNEAALCAKNIFVFVLAAFGASSPHYYPPLILPSAKEGGNNLPGEEG
jgi:hypothetical protein